MDKKALHEFYFDLVGNLWKELIFFIPEHEGTSLFISKLEAFKEEDVFNTVFVIDYYKGPMIYTSDRDKNTILLKSAGLDKNIFKLVQKKSETDYDAFQYVLNKYFEQAGCLYYITNWMTLNLHTTEILNDEIKDFFNIQCTHHKTHFEALLKQFYPSKEFIPADYFNAAEIIKKYFPDITRKHENKSQQVPSTSLPLDQPENKNLTIIKGENVSVKTEKQPLITKDAAKKELLKHIFNI